MKPSEIQRIKAVATQLLARLKEEKLRVDQWRDKEATRGAVRQAIHDFLWSEDTSLPMDCFAEKDVGVKAEDIFRHIYRAIPPCLRRFQWACHGVIREVQPNTLDFPDH